MMYIYIVVVKKGKIQNWKLKSRIEGKTVNNVVIILVLIIMFYFRNYAYIGNFVFFLYNEKKMFFNWFKKYIY